MPNESTLIAELQRRFPHTVLAAHQYRGQETVVLAREALLEAARALRDDPAFGFDLLLDLCGVDYSTFETVRMSAPTLATPSPLPYYMKPKAVKETWERLVSHDTYRFEVVYHFYSTGKNQRLRINVPVPTADPVVDSVTGLWQCADWFEREVWDMFGIRFTGHPNLRRILLYEEFQGHPLRKDYPVNKRQPLVGPVN
jgi:NADH-quinone oxidoreductase subunit C